MALPSWQDKSYGGMIRAALWLETVVGEGNVFTKTELRQAFPENTQIDRRVRDLRAHGWQIHTSREDPSLRQDEQRYVSRGAEVWIPGQARQSQLGTKPSRTQRSKIMAGDDFLCRSCGIGVGESYGDGGVETAQLNLARRTVLHPDGTTSTAFITECKRCIAGGSERQVDLGALLTEVAAFSPLERKVLGQWIEADRRTPSSLERFWGRYRTLPGEVRDAVRQAVHNEAS
jgi:hypothetical protein